MKQYRNSLPFWLLAALLWPLSATAQTGDLGLPILQFWTAKEYDGHEQNWGVAQDGRGILYFANTNGVLVYDGVSWATVPLTHQSAVKAVAADASGTVYVGGVNDFGYLAPDSLGRLGYVSLVGQLPEGVSGFKDVWDVYCAGDAVYFRTSSYLFKKTAKGIEARPAQKRFHRSYLASNTLYVLQPGIGLCRWEADSVRLLPNGGNFASRRIYALMPHASGQLLVCTEQEGLVLLDPRTGQETPWGTPEANDFLVKKQAYRGLPITHGRYAFGTADGVLLADAEGKILQIIDKRHGIGGGDVLGMGMDRDGALWLGLNDGLARLETHLPFFFYPTAPATNGSVYTLELLGNELFAGSSGGLLGMRLGEEQAFRLLPLEMKTSVWDIHPYRQANGDTCLMLATTAGLVRYRLRDGKSEVVRASSRAMFALEPASGPEPLLYIGMSSGFAVLDLATDQFRCYYDSLPDKVRDIAQGGPDGTLWLGTSYSGFVRVSPKAPFDYSAVELAHYDTLKGLPELGNHYIFQLGGKQAFSTRTFLYEYDPASDRFVRSPLLDYQVGGDFQTPALMLEGSSQGDIWAFGLFRSKNRLLHFFPGKDGHFSWTDRVFKRLYIKTIYDLKSAPDGSLWIAFSDGVVHYRADMAHQALPAQALVARVVVGEDSLVYGGGHSEQAAPLHVPYQRHLPISFYYAATAYSRASTNLYAYQLEGYDEDWSNWHGSTKKEYTGLWPGTYTFRVKAKDIYDVESHEGTFTLVVDPPWYLTWWAYLGYALLLAGLVWGIVKWNLRRLLREKAQLEQVVADRTAELRQRHAELQQQQEEIHAQSENLKEANALISQRNQKITASIAYAYRIQQAVQVPASAMRACLPDSFVMLRPKDIVSGDFFWFAEAEGKYVVAAADCTGHGVPGAFMSMIGQMLLKEVVMLYQVTSPAAILEMLDSMVRANLSQGGSSARDGMDMAVCVLDPKARILAFAGAKNPLYCLGPGGEEILLKGTKRPVGGHDMQAVGEFEEHTLDVSEGPYSCYLFSDGFADQFGGPEGKKLMGRAFRERLKAGSALPMAEQQAGLERFFQQWQGPYAQIDDVLVVGFRV